MNLGLGFSPLPGFLAGTATVAAIMISQLGAVIVYTPEQVAQLAIPRTVRIGLDKSYEPSGGGSGVIIARRGKTYTVLTADHVVKWSDLKYTIRTSTGKEYPVTKVQRLAKSETDPDLAVVIFDSSETYPVATLGDSDRVAILAPIYVCGYPLPGDGSGSERTREVVPGSITSRLNSGNRGYTMRYEAVTRSGMSGGPVFDANGRVIGIHGLSDSEGAFQTASGDTAPIRTGFNSAIPINTFMALMSQAGLSRSDLTVDDAPVASIQQPNPKDANTNYIRGLSRYDRGDKQGAVEDFSQALRENPNNANAYSYRGNVRYELGDRQGAFADYTQAIQIDPNLGAAYYNRGLVRYEQKDKQGAIEDYTQAIRVDPSFAAAYNSRGLARSDLGEQQSAITDYNQALRINPNRANTYYNRGLAYFRLTDYQQALTDYTQAIRLNPNYAKAYGNRGITHLQLGNKQSAIADLQQAAQLFYTQGQIADYQRALNRIRDIR